MTNKFWIEIFDKDDTDTIVDSFESMGQHILFKTLR